MSLISTLLKITETCTPLSTLTYLSGKITDVPLGKFTRFLIDQFIKTYNIDVSECENEDLNSYRTFNEFFIRKLKADLRPVDPNATAISPVDGTIGQADNIVAGRLIQAKGLDYSLQSLLGGNKADCDLFENGNFACIYLSPANYHRIHMPIDGKLVKTIHIPGKHFPVGRKNISYMPNLYTVNERLVCIFDTKIGPFAVVMVGAAMVGSINTVWDGTVVRRKGIAEKTFNSDDYQFKKGDEIGHFKFGSTVICLWEKDAGELSDNVVPNEPIRFGQPLIK